jgi:SEC-C motif-containing protein
MRSRYCAYARGLTDYILDTTAPESPHGQLDRAAWKAEVERFCAQSRFVGLTVHAAECERAQGQVHFTARLMQDGREVRLEERSRFVRRDGRWFYVEAIQPA